MTNFPSKTQTEIQKLIDSLQVAILICQEASQRGDNISYEKTYPYATGYSRSCMSEVVTELKKYQSIL